MMAIRLLLLKEFRFCLGRLWRTTFTAAWNGLRKVAGSGPPLTGFRDTPVSPFAEILEQRHLESLRTVAEQVSALQEERSGPACRSVQAKLTGNRQATLRALEAAYPALTGITFAEAENIPDKIDCHVHATCESNWSIAFQDQAMTKAD